MKKYTIYKVEGAGIYKDDITTSPNSRSFTFDGFQKFDTLEKLEKTKEEWSKRETYRGDEYVIVPVVYSVNGEIYESIPAGEFKAVNGKLIPDEKWISFLEKI